MVHVDKLGIGGRRWNHVIPESDVKVSFTMAGNMVGTPNRASGDSWIFAGSPRRFPPPQAFPKQGLCG